MDTFKDFREKVCVSKAESVYEKLLKKYRGQGYWIPELNEDVDVEAIESQLPEMEKKLIWIRQEKENVKTNKFPKTKITSQARDLLSKLLILKKTELETDESEKIKARKESLKLLGDLQQNYEDMLKKLSFFTNYNYPVDHLKNRKIHDLVREKEDDTSVKSANKAFLYRKIQEDGTFNKDHGSPDIYFRTTLDTLHYGLQQHDFWLSEDARYDLEFILAKIETELDKGKDKVLERLTEWEHRTTKTLKFYRSLTLPENRQVIVVNGEKSTPNRLLIEEHNRATDELKKFVYGKQAEVYKYWLNRPELLRAIFVLETILLNEVGAVDGDDALERMDVARVVMNRLDKPKYLSIGKKDFIHPYLKDIAPEATLKNERWLNALLKQGEFSFTYYYMSGVPKIFCPDIAPAARRLREKNVEIALQALKEGPVDFHTTRYFSRASMVGRIHMDSIWEDYVPYPERPGLLAAGQETLHKALSEKRYTYLYSFKDQRGEIFQVLEVEDKNYALGNKNGLKIFYHYRNPHYFRYFNKISKH